MKHDETLAQLQALRETVTRIVRDVDDAIAYLEGFQPVVEAFRARQAAVQAQWDDLVHAGGPDNLNTEAQMRHATAVRAAEITLMNALRDYLASAQPPVSNGEQPETHAEQSPPVENAAQEYHPY
jgi:hypothetical protein